MSEEAAKYGTLPDPDRIALEGFPRSYEHGVGSIADLKRNYVQLLDLCDRVLNRVEGLMRTWSPPHSKHKQQTFTSEMDPGAVQKLLEGWEVLESTEDPYRRFRRLRVTGGFLYELVLGVSCTQFFLPGRIQQFTAVEPESHGKRRST